MLGGVQSGKTTGGAAWELMQWAAKPKADHLILAPTYKILQHSTLRKLDSLIPKGWAEYNKGDACYHLRTGGKAFVRSVEDPDSIEGLSAASVWGDEAGKYVVKAWENIQARRAATQGPVLFTTTPYGMNWLKDQFYDLWLKGLPEYRVIHFRSIDSPFFPKAEWDRAKRDMPAKVFNRKFSGLFTPLEGLIYEEFDADTMDIPFPFERVPEAWQKIAGIDHGHSEGHPAAVSFFACENFDNPRAPIWKVGEVKAHGLLLAELWKRAEGIMTSFVGQVNQFYADPSAAQENAELKVIMRSSTAYDFSRARINAGINAVDWGIEQVQGLMKRGRFRLAKGRCSQTKDEFSVYSRDEKHRIIKESDHLMDADRYALATHLKPAQRIRNQ